MRIPIEKLEVIEASRREPGQGPSRQTMPTDDRRQVSSQTDPAVSISVPIFRGLAHLASAADRESARPTWPGATWPGGV
jgi:hypothetical protein